MTEIYIDVGTMKSGTKFREYILYPKLKDVLCYPFCFSRENPMLYDYNKSNKILLADESLSGELYRPECDVQQQTNAINNMKKFFPDAHILICVRKGESFIQSAYRQYVFSGGIDTFENWSNRINMNNFVFDDYIRKLKKYFDDVLVLDFDLFKKDYVAFLKLSVILWVLILLFSIIRR